MSQATIAVPEKPVFTAKEIAFTVMFSALIAICSWISIPTAVPFTLQTFAIYCALECLGGKKGFFAVLVYILLGAVGVPVFAGFSGGLGVILGTVLCYVFGTAWFMYVYTKQTEAIDLATALSWCVTPFLGSNVLKLALAIIVSDRVKKYVKF
ncbi:MAG: biotin transporter BioY [Oscillospiraceae bacterium]|nr:biotin transporter BioY [Oscillospiraceae bacterium]